MRDKPAGSFGNILKFIGLSAIAGVLGVGLLAPAVTIGGWATTTGIAVFENIPDYIKPVNASDASNIYAKDGSKDVRIASFFEENRISVPFNEMSKNIVNAVVSTEDPRFYQHDGVDWISLIRATLTNLATVGNGPGGSTITMQYVKNAQVTAAAQAGNQAAVDAATQSGLGGLGRKIQQIRMALALEKQVSKQDILAGYLNLSFFGNQIYGIEAAANYYFNVHAKDLNIQQAAMLAAMLKSPNDYKPDVAVNLDRAKSRRDYVIDNMASAGYISQGQADAAKAAPIEVHLTNDKSGCEADQTTAFFCDFVVWTVRNSPEFGPTPQDREQLLRRGGLDIYTTLDTNLQAAADAASKKYVPPSDPSQIGSASVSVQVGTGRILALAENRVYDQTASGLPGHTSVNYATDKPYGGSSGFQVGSTYKIFTLGQWLATGHHLMDRVDGRVRNYHASDFSARCGVIGGDWQPNNDVNNEPQNPTVVQATAISENTAFANMASQLDLCDIRDLAARFGIHRADGTELLYYPSSVLGVNEIAPLSVAAAMAGISNNGTFCTPVAIDHVVVRSTQQQLTVPQTQCSQAVTPDVAHGMIYAMHAVMTGGTGGGSNTGDGAFLAGKTGTTDSGVHTWMSGFSSTVATSTWVGNVVGTKSMRGITINKKLAATLRHDIWRSIMKEANKIYVPAKSMPAPPAEMIDSAGITVPNVVGQTPDAAVATMKQAGLNGQVSIKSVASGQPSGTVASTKPAVGSVASSGTTVIIYVSKGGMSVVPDVSGKSVSDATATLLAAGFSAVSAPQSSQTQFFQHSATIPKGMVVGTDPAAGSSAQGAGAVLLIISLGP
ncbi:MAG: transglycosylase domain-containing protein [Actinomycetales bacterium]|nr:transglycosylase domain-containing protein [Actinomycetales bacterium]